MTMWSFLLHLWSACAALLARNPAIIDAIRLAAAGLFFEGCRRGMDRLYAALVRASTMTVLIDSQDDLYTWMIEWMTTQPNLMPPVPTSDTNMTSVPRPRLLSTLFDLMEEIHPTGRGTPRTLELGVLSDNITPMWMLRLTRGTTREKGPLIVRPAKSKPVVCDFQGYKVHILLGKDDKMYLNEHGMQVSSSIFRGSLPLYAALAEHVRTLSSSRYANTLSVYTPGGGGRSNTSGDRWGKAASRSRRPWDSVILPKEMKADLLADAKEFLDEKAFYEDRGLPWRRGYLLHGVPGAGKSSLIAALASKLSLDIYMVNLGATLLDDSRLLTLLQTVPAKSILVIEDVDCAFDDRKKSDQLNDANEEAPMSTVDAPPSASPANPEPRVKRRKDGDAQRSGVTLSGLLNGLDGVASSEGRLLFCTTNYVDRIDKALSRPGRCDVWIEFMHATSEQIRELFMLFYAPSVKPASPASQQRNGEGPLPRLEHAGASDLFAFRNSEKAIDGELDLDDLANRFVDGIPEGEVTTAALQAYLLRFKRRPGKAVDGVAEWVKGGYLQNTKEAPKQDALLTITGQGGQEKETGF